MSDYLIRILAKDLGIRGLACITTDMANEGARRHKTTPAATAVLSNGLTGATLMGALLKVKQRVAIKFEGDGPLQKMLVESDSYGRVRGYVDEPNVDLPVESGRSAAQAAIGSTGMLTVVKDLRTQDLTTGVVRFINGQVDHEIGSYLNNSEQTPSVVEIDTVLDDDGKVLVAGGILFQVLPGEEAETLHAFAERLDDIPPLGDALKNGAMPESILATIMAGFDYETLEKRDVMFHCQCSWERSEKALKILPHADLEILIAEGQGVVDCHFCHERYIFGREALEMMLDNWVEVKAALRHVRNETPCA